MSAAISLVSPPIAPSTQAAPKTASTSFSSRLNPPTEVAGVSTDQADLMALIKLQIAMQQENQLFTAISNILKIRHETMKTIIGNIR